ncbi:23060_t:CDS:2, partial [Racocetra persica]
LVSRYKKHNNISKQRNTGTYLTRYECEGLLSIFIDLINQYANIKLNYKQLHQRPQFIGVTEQVKQYIHEHLILRASKLYQEIITKKLDRRHDDQYESVKLFLSEKDYKIILNLDKPMHVFSFLTGFFNKLLRDAFNT